MAKKRRETTSIDGVGQRQRRRSLGDFKDIQQISGDSFSQRQRSINKAINEPVRKQEEVEIITEEDIIENTRSEVDKSNIGGSGWRARRRAKKLAKKRKLAKRSKWFRGARYVLRFGMFTVIGVGLYLGISSIVNLSNIIDRGGDGALALQDNILPSQLKGEGDGRINIMMIGIGGDSHVAGDLADSIIVASIDPFANEMAMLSIPRDLYVSIPSYYSTRINAAHSIGEEQNHPGGGIALMQETLEQILDINLHYYVRVDFEGFEEAIDTVGGVTINLENPVYDPNFDWQFGTDALNLPAGDVSLDGQTALLLARSRNATGLGYGTSNDFDRAENQRKVLVALKDKVLSLGTFANPIRINSLLGSAGNHARTNLQISEMLRLYEIMERIPQEKIISYGLDSSAENYLVNDNIDGASVLVPRGGSFEEIQLFVRELFIDGFIRTEGPVVDIYNGTVVAGLAGDTAAELSTYGYKIGTIANAQEQTFAKSVAYDLSDGKKPFTKALLQQRFDVVMKPANQIPEEYASSDSDFVIIIGDKYVQQETTF